MYCVHYPHLSHHSTLYSTIDSIQNSLLYTVYIIPTSPNTQRFTRDVKEVQFNAAVYCSVVKQFSTAQWWVVNTYNKQELCSRVHTPNWRNLEINHSWF